MDVKCVTSKLPLVIKNWRRTYITIQVTTQYGCDIDTHIITVLSFFKCSVMAAHANMPYNEFTSKLTDRQERVRKESIHDKLEAAPIDDKQLWVCGLGN